MTFKGHVLNAQIDDDLPFYSQVILTSSAFHKDKGAPEPGSKNKFLFKSLDPVVTKDDIKNIVLADPGLSAYFNTQKRDLEVTEKGDNMYHTEVVSGSVEIPRVVTVKCPLSFYIDSESLIEKELARKNTPLNVQRLQKECDEYMSKYDLENEISKKLRKKVVVDEEGFQLVTAGPLPIKASELAQRKKKKLSK